MKRIKSDEEKGTALYSSTKQNTVQIIDAQRM